MNSLEECYRRLSGLGQMVDRQAELVERLRVQDNHPVLPQAEMLLLAFRRTESACYRLLITKSEAQHLVRTARTLRDLG